MKKITVKLFELYFRKSAIAPQLTQRLAYILEYWLKGKIVPGSACNHSNMKELFQPLWNIYMRNQKLETELAYKHAKWNTQNIIRSYYRPLHYIHTLHGVFFVAHKAIIVRTSKISSCLSHIFLILTGVSRDGRKITTTRKHLTISFGARRNRYKTNKIAFFNFKNIHFSSN